MWYCLSYIMPTTYHGLYKFYSRDQSLSLVSHCYPTEKQMTTKEVTMAIIMDYKLSI